MGYFLSNPDDWRISVADPVARGGDGAKAVYSGLRELVTAGYVHRSSLRDAAGRIRCWEHVVYETPPPLRQNGEVDGTAGAQPSHPHPGFPTSPQRPCARSRGAAPCPRPTSPPSSPCCRPPWRRARCATRAASSWPPSNGTGAIRPRRRTADTARSQPEPAGAEDQDATSGVSDLVAALTSVGVTPEAAVRLVRDHPGGVQRQLLWLQHRTAHDPAALLVRAVTEDWSEPPAAREARSVAAARAEAEQLSTSMDRARE